MIIKYKANDMSTPKGKPKVYYACHPNDFDTTFSLISDDILNISSCTIWYDSSLARPIEQEGIEIDLEDALSEMQLIVIAVTSMFLHCGSEARDRVLPFALKNHIPVLPIMLENELKNEFNKTCAKIQAVDRYVTDSTSTPYEEVLKTFLNSVLVGEELANKVRAAFDAYVFLSYRKKDRKYAHRLMRLIHENEQFRDIAIWYDEYLVPGESFNDAIKIAFANSSLFAMAVTPNLEDTGNYVMRVEYPMARDRKSEEANNNKQYEIVPVEMYEPAQDGETPWRIDISKLKNKEFKYEEIPDLKDEHRLSEMNQSFINALERIAKKENDGSTRHQFLIGLAYLNGIDVEINHERALRLISAAADNPDDPCMEATAKLADMYINGEGVKADALQAIVWQEKLASQYKAAHEKNHNPDAHMGYGTEYFKALRKLSEMYRDTGKIEMAISTAEKALAFSNDLEIEVGVRERERDNAIILNRLGALYCDLRKYSLAEERYIEACRIYKKLVSEIGTYRSRRDLSISYERLGDLSRREGDLSKADEYYHKTREIREQLYEQMQTMTSTRDLSAVMTKLGNIQKSKGCFDDATVYYSKALDFDYGLALETKTVQAWDDYGVSLVKCGDISKVTGKFKEAEKLYKEAYSIFNKNAESTGSLAIQGHMAVGCGKLADIKQKLGKMEEAEELYLESVRLHRIQCDMLNSVSAFHALASAYYKAAAFLEDKKMMRNAYDIWDKLSEIDQKYMKYRDKAEKMDSMIK